MADVSKINLYGTNYNIKDATARSTISGAKTAADNAQNTANEAKTAADNAQNTANVAKGRAESNSTNISKLSTEGIVIAYEQKNETINVTKGINLS